MKTYKWLAADIKFWHKVSFGTYMVIRYKHALYLDIPSSYSTRMLVVLTRMVIGVDSPHIQGFILPVIHVMLVVHDLTILLRPS